MDFGALDIQVFLTLGIVLFLILVALITDYLKGSNEQLRLKNAELRARQEEREKLQQPLQSLEFLQSLATLARDGALAQQNSSSLQAGAGAELDTLGDRKPSDAAARRRMDDEMKSRAAAKQFASKADLEQLAERAARIRARHRALRREGEEAVSFEASPAPELVVSGVGREAEVRELPSPAAVEFESWLTDRKPKQSVPASATVSPAPTVTAQEPVLQEQALDHAIESILPSEPSISAEAAADEDAVDTELVAVDSVATAGEPEFVDTPAPVAAIVAEPLAEPAPKQVDEPAGAFEVGSYADEDLSALLPPPPVFESDFEATVPEEARPAEETTIPSLASILGDEELRSGPASEPLAAEAVIEEAGSAVIPSSSNEDTSKALVPLGATFVDEPEAIPVESPEAKQQPAPAAEGSYATFPPGLHDAIVLETLLKRNQVFVGVAASISINDFEGLKASLAKSGDAMDSVRNLIRSVMTPDDFACQYRPDEFILLYPNHTGHSAQRRLFRISEKIWDFQLRSLGHTGVMFSWGGLEVSGEPLTNAVNLARERMESTRRTRSKGGSIDRTVVVRKVG